MERFVPYFVVTFYVVVSKNIVICKVAPEPVASWALTATKGGTDLKGDNDFTLTNLEYGVGPYGESDGAVILPADSTQSMVVKNPTDALSFTTGMTYFTQVFLTGATLGPLFEYNSAISPDVEGEIGTLLWVWPNVTDLQVDDTGGVFVVRDIIKKNAWHKIAVVWSSSQLRFYVNGYLEGYANSAMDLSRTLTGHIHVGRRPGILDSGLFLSGRMACVQFYDKPLSGDEVKHLTCQQYAVSSITETPAFLFMNGEELCRVDIHDITDPSTSHPVCVYSGMGHFLRVDVRMNNSYMVFNDPNQNIHVVEQHLGPDSIYTLLTTYFRGVYGLYYDWKGGNLFWSDHNTNNIGLYNLHTKSYIPIVTDLPNPAGLVVDIPTGRVFWADASPSISWTTIGSTEKNYLITSDLAGTDILAIDIADRRLYWNNNLDGTISSADITTNTAVDIRIMVSNVDPVLGIALSEDFIFWTDKSGAHVAQKHDGQRVKDFPDTDTSYYVVYNALYSQPLEQDGCSSNNGGCEQICVPAPSGGHMCLCKTGYHTEDNGQSCITDYLSDDFILYTDDVHNTLYQADLITGDTHAVEFPLIFEFPFAIVYDSQDMTVFFTDVYTENVYKYQIDDPSSIEIIHQFPETSFLNGIAHDQETDKLYITDAGDGVIYRIDTQGVHLEYFVANAGSPRDIVVDTKSRTVYWTDWNATHAHILRSDMDDPDSRRAIITGQMEKPNGITIDAQENRLYWVDSEYGRIEASDLNGNSRQIVVNKLDGFMLSVFSDRQYLYATDSTLGYIYEIEKHTKSVTNKHKIHGKPIRIAVHSTPQTTTTKSTTSSDAHSTTATHSSNDPQELGDEGPLDPLLMYIIIGVGGFIVLVIVVTVGAVCCYKRRHTPPQPAVGPSPPPYTADNPVVNLQMQSTPSNAQATGPSLRYSEHPIDKEPTYTELTPGTVRPPMVPPLHMPPQYEHQRVMPPMLPPPQRPPVRLPTTDNPTYLMPMPAIPGGNAALMSDDPTYASMLDPHPDAKGINETESTFFNDLRPARVENPGNN